MHPSAVRIASALAAGTVLIGALVLVGWTVGSELLMGRLAGDMIIMLPNTAVGFLTAGAALGVLRDERRQGVARTVALGCAWLVLALGVLTFLERMSGRVFGIDLILFAERVRAYPYLPPGQMATNSTVCFILAGIGLLFLSREPRDGPLGRELVAVAGLGVSGLALLGHFYGASALYTFDRAAGMALLTAVAFLMVHVGLLWARPSVGLVALVSGRDLTGRVLRPLLGAGLAVPVLSGWIWIKAHEDNVFSPEGGIAVLTMLMLLLLVLVMIETGRVLRSTDQRREALLERERELRAVAEAARLDAEAANRVKTEFLGTMSHELRTPLNAIIGYTELMEERLAGPLTERQTHHLERVRMSAQHLRSLIDQVFALARLEARAMRPTMVDVEARALAEEVAGIAEPLFAAKGVRFVAEVLEDARIRTDPARVRQILLNLLANAIKFTETGEVRLAVVGDDQRPIIAFEVTDTGIGIDENDHEKIFDPFWQVERSHTRAYEGVGLGLGLSREQARLLGGDLTVRSRLGGGSCFRLELPLDPGAPVAGPRAHASAGGEPLPD